MQVQAQEIMPSARSKLKVQGEAIVCIKPQARETRLMAQGKEQREWTVHKVSQRTDPGNSLVILRFGSAGSDFDHEVPNRDA